MHNQIARIISSRVLKWPDKHGTLSAISTEYLFKDLLYLLNAYNNSSMLKYVQKHLTTEACFKRLYFTVQRGQKALLDILYRLGRKKRVGSYARSPEAALVTQEKQICIGLNTMPADYPRNILAWLIRSIDDSSIKCQLQKGIILSSTAGVLLLISYQC